MGRQVIRCELHLSGNVQGVSLRYLTKRKAGECNVTGWVMNKSDGTVQAVFEGEKVAIQKMIAWYKTGMGRGLSMMTDILWSEETKGYKDFSIRIEE